MDTLPLDIIRECIMPYTYSPQPPKLCMDIQSFAQVKELLDTNYAVNHGDEFYDWMANDISRFLNNDLPTMLGYHDFFMNVLKRSMMLKNKSFEQLVYFEQNTTYKMSSMRESNMKLALLDPLERTHLINFMIANNCI